MSDNMEDSNDNNILVESAERNAADEMDGEEEDSDYDEEESDDESDWIDFDEDILRRLKDNDPTVFSLSVMCSGEGFNALSIDWKLEGGAIAENTHLKSLSTTYYNPEGDENAAAITNAKAFYGALSKNRSIKNLSMDGCPIDAGDMMKLLSPIFDHNNLRSLIICHFDLSERSARFLASNLLECNPASLRKFVFRINGEGDDGWQAKIVAALDIHHNLRRLTLCFNQYNIGSEGWCIALGRLLQRPNSKLKDLDIIYNSIDDEGAAALGDALGRNKSLKKISLGSMGCTITAWKALLRGLSCSSLEEINLSENIIGNILPLVGANATIGDDGTLTYAVSTAKCRSLKSLYLCHVQSISSFGWRTILGSLLKHESSVLEKLYLYDNNIDDRGLSELGSALVNNSTLKALILARNRSITAAGWLAFFGCLSNLSSSSLENLNVSVNNIDNGGLAALANAVGNSSTLTSLNLCMCELISSVGWETFFNRLQTCHLVLGSLCLSCNNIDDAGISSLVIALSNASSLSSLYLGSNSSVTPVGWMALSTLLQRPGSNLDHLFISDTVNSNSINEEVMIGFANALVSNTSLKTLEYGLNLGTSISSRGIDTIGNLLCDKSSIDSIYRSNHTLQKLGWSDIHLHTDLTSFFKLNQNDNKAEVARQKILQYHFSNGDNNIQDLVDMSLNVIPHAIAWVGRDDTARSLLYHLVHGMPSLFDFRGKAKAVGGTKRKRLLI